MGSFHFNQYVFQEMTNKFFERVEQGIRKDVGRAFGVLQGRFHII